MPRNLKCFFAERRRNLLFYLSVFGSAFFLFWLFLYRFSYAPFGENSLAWADANIQYLDFFSYYKDVILGKNDVGYTFTKALGGTNIASFSYYLASPFHLLVVFFEKEELHTFLDVLISLKLSTAALTCAVFFKNRFSERLRNRYILLLALGYAFMQYSIAQCSNVMWLDGVYMLPLILLGVYRLVRKQSIYLLSVSVGAAILFNWYSAGIDCVFAIFWFFFELTLYHMETRRTFLQNIRSVFRFGCSMAIGVMLSGVLFLPTIAAMKDSAEGTFDWDLIKNEFMGELFSVVHNYSLSGTSTWGSVSLYCGSFVLIGCLGFFFSKKISLSGKITAGIFLTVSVLSYYWVPLVFLFSLLKNAESYLYRHSYVTIFLLLFLAAMYYAKSDEEEQISFLTLRCAMGFSGILFLLNYVHPVLENKYVYATAFFLISISILLESEFKVKAGRKGLTSLISGMMIFLVCLELHTNTALLAEQYHASDVEAFRNYQKETSEQISALQNYDNGKYRISQTTTRNMGSDGLTAYYNEGMAFNYMSITEYSSAPNGLQMDFLSRLGYRCEGLDMQIVNTSILGADALLGVKYVLSPYDVNGLEKVEELGSYNEKAVYENPYALPLAFLYRSSGVKEIPYENPFEYQNKLYSELAGETVCVYQKVSYERQEKENKIIYTLEIPEGSYALYGNLPWNSYMNAKINVNGEREFSYSKWLSASVFYIPSDENAGEATVTVETENPDLADEQFYALDLEALGEITDLISRREADNLSIQNGQVLCSVEAEEGDSLFLSVPYHSGWTILRNGEKTEPELFGECLISVPLTEGINEIKMTYHVPMLKAGICFTGIGVLILCILFLYNKSQEKGLNKK